MTMKKAAFNFLLFLAYLTPHICLAEQEIISTIEQQKLVQLTVYNRNLALIKDTRAVTLNSGLNQLAIKDVSAQMQPETALLKSISSPNKLQLIEQNFDFDLLTPQKLLEKYVGKTVTLIKQNPKTGIETAEQATVLAVNQGTILKVGNRIESGNIGGRIVYDNIPDNLRERPTLVTELVNTGARQQTIELSYLSSGLDWHTDYVAELSKNSDYINLSGWVTLNNNSGTSYQNAQLQLVAGDVNRVRKNMQYAVKSAQYEMAAAAPAPMKEESLLEYHLYTLPRATTIKDKQTKQISLLNANRIPVKKSLILRGRDYYYRSQYRGNAEKIKLDVMVDFINKKSHHLGVPLPKGTIRVYKNDQSGRTQFVGEDSIDHTANNSPIRLKLGQSFDVTATRKQTDFKVISRKSNTYESAYEITVHNGKTQSSKVTIQEPINGDWKIISENQSHQKLNSRLAQWHVTVPAEGKLTLQYRVRVKY